MTLFASKSKNVAADEKVRLTLELAEIKEISNVLFKRLEKKIRDIEVLEASLDRKIATIERLMQQPEPIPAPAGGGMNRRNEIIALQQKGLGNFDIAQVLDMPQGEVDLILELYMSKA
jgi:hypothetical protein